jgi:hypothetical protein
MFFFFHLEAHHLEAHHLEAHLSTNVSLHLEAHLSTNVSPTKFSRHCAKYSLYPSNLKLHISRGTREQFNVTLEQLLMNQRLEGLRCRKKVGVFFLFFSLDSINPKPIKRDPRNHIIQPLHLKGVREGIF